MSKSTVQDAIKNRKVRYSMPVGRLVIRSGDKQVVDVGGRYKEITLPGLELVAEGEYRESGQTREFDPTDPEDAAIIAEVDEFIARAHRPECHQMYKLGHGEVKIPWQKFNELKNDAIIETIRNGVCTVEHAIEYESQKPKDEQRKSLLVALEKLAAEEPEQVDATAVPQL